MLDRDASFSEALLYRMESVGIENLDELAGRLDGDWVERNGEGVFVEYDGDFVRAVISNAKHSVHPGFWQQLGEAMGLDLAERAELVYLWIDSHAA
jgi:hypothetical protein